MREREIESVQVTVQSDVGKRFTQENRRIISSVDFDRMFVDLLICMIRGAVLKGFLPVFALKALKTTVA